MRTIECTYCSKPFTWHLSTLSESGKMYCSTRCRVGKETHHFRHLAAVRKARHKSMLQMRLAGAKVSKIGLVMGITDDTVKDYLRRYGAKALTGEAVIVVQ